MKMKLDIVDIMDALQSGVNAQILIKEIYNKALYSKDFDRDWLIDVIEDYMNGDE
jgi:hypothetical protein